MSSSVRHLLPWSVLCLGISACLCGDPPVYALPEVLIQVTDTHSCEDKPARLDATAVGGIPPYQYRWEPQDGLSDPNSPLTFAAPGASTEYTVHVVDSRGRRSNHTVFVERRLNPVAKISAGSVTTFCAEAELALDGASSVDADGNPVATYVWEVDGQLRGSSTSPNLTPFVPQDGQVVRLTVQDEKGCIGFVEETLSVRPLPSTTLTFDAGAPDACDGSPLAMSVDAIDADGGAVASIAWDLDGDPSTIESTNAQSGAFDPFTGTVSVTVTDSLGCVRTLRQDVVKHAPPTPVIAFTHGAPKVCEGGSVALDGSGSTDAYGAAPATWEWDFDGDTSTVEWDGPLPPGLDVPTPRVARLTVTDVRGCSASTETTIDTRAPPSLSLAFDKGSASECLLDPVAIRAAGTDSEGGALTRVDWDLDGNPATVEATGFTSPELRPAGDTVVFVRAVDRFGCTTSSTVALTPRPLPTARIEFSEGRADVCAGDAVRLSALASSDADGNPVVSYAWSAAADIGSVSSPTTSSFVPVASGNVSLTVAAANGCTATTSQWIAPRALPQPRMAFSLGGASVCDGQPVALADDGSLDADLNPVVSWSWDLDGDGQSDVTGPASGDFVPAVGSAASLTVVDALGCTNSTTQTFDLGELPTPVIAFARGTNAVCAGDDVVLDGSASVDASGSAVATYAWDLDGDPATTEFTGAQPPALVPTGATSIRLRVTDARGCYADAFETLNSLPLPTARIAFAEGRDDVCLGDAVRLDGTNSTDASGSASLAYAWDLDGDGVIDTTASVSGSLVPTAARMVKLTVTDSNGCSSDAVQSITPRSLPTPRIAFTQGGSFVCDGNSIALDATTSTDADGNPVDHYAWDWDGNPATAEATAAQTGAFQPQTGNVVLRVVDALGCEASLTQNVEVGDLPTPVIAFTRGANAVCAGDDVALDGGGSRDAFGNPVMAYAWDLDGDPATTEFTGAQPSPLVPNGPTSIRLRVTDDRGCHADAFETLNSLPMPTARIAFAEGRDDVCLGDAVRLDGTNSTDASGSASLAYAWDLDGDGVIDTTASDSGSLVPTAARTVKLTVTDSNGCSSDATQSITPRALPTPRVAFTQGGSFVCDGNSIALDATTSTDADGNPVDHYAWDWDGNPATTEATGAQTGAFQPQAGNVVLRVVDTLGCEASLTQSIEVGELPTPVIAFTHGASEVCAGGEVVLDGSGSIDALGDAISSYAWDLDGNPATTEFTGAQPPAIVPTGALSVRLRVTDARGCFADAYETLDALGMPTARISFVEGHATSCHGDAIVLSGATSSSGSGGSVASYRWEYDGDPNTVESTSATLDPLTPSAPLAIRLHVTDENGCEAQTEAQLDPRALPEARITFDTGAPGHCAGDDVVLSGATSTDADGNPVAMHAWDLQSDGSEDHFADRTPTLVSSSPRTVTLRVRDAEGCESTATQSLSPRPLPTPQVAFVQGRANVCAGGTVELSAAGSRDADDQPVTTFAWDLDGDSASIESISASTGAWTPTGEPARLTVTDAVGCSASAVQPIQPRALPTPRVSFVSGGDFVCDGGTVALDASSSTDADGNAVASYAWDLDGNPASIEVATALTGDFEAEGAVRLTVTDGDGCVASVVQDIEVGALPVPRIAYLDGSSAECRGEWITIDGSASTDALGSANVAFEWDFDGDFSSVESTAATPPGFPLDADTSVRLRVTDANGCSAQAEENLVARLPPTAQISFLAGHETSCQGDLVTLTGADSSSAANTSIASFAWDLDGDFGSIESTSDTLNPMSPAGQLVARLRVTDEFGCWDETSQAVSPRALPTPRVTFAQGHANACSGDAVVVSGATSTDADGNPVSSYAWDLDGDGTAEQFVATPGAIHPTQPRSVSLRVTDAQGCFVSESQVLEPRPLPTAHVAFVQGRADVCVGDAVQLTAAGSRDVDNQPVTGFAWELDAAPGIDSTNATTAVYVPSGAPARVTVTDAQGCSSSVQQPITPRALPTPVLSYVAGGANVCSGDMVELSAVGSTDADGNPVSLIAWDLDADGTADRFDVTTGAFTPVEAQRVKLTVVDDRACQASTEESFSVRARPVPQFEIAGPRTFICGGDPVELDGSASRDGYGATVASYAWDLDGVPGTTESTAAITHSFVPSGPVSLDVSDGVCSATHVESVLTGGPRTLFDLGGNSEAQLKAAVDIILVVDNSGSMEPFIQATQNAINQHFADILDDHDIDYRVIVISAFGRSQDEEICISSPLSGLSCGNGGGWWNRPPVFGPRFFHYDLKIESRDGFSKVLDSYDKRDQHGLAPNGWQAWLRPGVVKAFIEITDDDTNVLMPSWLFDTLLRAKSTQHFGSANNRNYVWYGIFGMKENNPASRPYEPTDPIVTQKCGQATRAGTERQELSRMTGGLRFPICNPGNFNVMFERLAESVIEIVRVDCEFDLSDVNDGPDESTIAVEYTPGGGGNVQLLLPAADLASCTPNHFYREGNMLKLCPAACTRIQEDTGASLALSGCHAP